MGKTEKIVLTEKQQKWLIAHFKHTKNDEIMERLGLSHSTLHRFARELGLKKSRQFVAKCQAATTEAAWKANRRRGWPPKGYQIPNAPRFQPGVNNLMRLGPEREAERQRKSTERRNKTIAAEKRRVLFGLPQKTKLKVVAAPKEKIAYRHSLRKRGYEIERGSSDAYVVETTQRNLTIEERARKYGIHVILPDEEEN